MKYVNPEYAGWETVQHIIQIGSIEEIASIVIGVALEENDLQKAQELFMHLAHHSSDAIRGNALLGFGHLARRFGQLDHDNVKPLIEMGLTDNSNSVRMHASSAADDVEFFLKWNIQKP